MVGECLLIPVWRPVRVGFIGKWELGGEWVGIGGSYTKSICPVHLVDGYG